MCSPWSTIAAPRPRSFMRWSMSRFMFVPSRPEENGLVGKEPGRDDEHDRGDDGMHGYDRVGQDLALEERGVQDRDHEALHRWSSELPEADEPQDDRGHVHVGRIRLALPHAPRETPERDQRRAQEDRGG